VNYRKVKIRSRIHDVRSERRIKGVDVIFTRCYLVLTLLDIDERVSTRVHKTCSQCIKYHKIQKFVLNRSTPMKITVDLGGTECEVEVECSDHGFMFFVWHKDLDIIEGGNDKELALMGLKHAIQDKYKELFDPENDDLKRKFQKLIDNQEAK